MTIYRSECGKYLCRASSRGWGRFNAWLADGSIHWRDDDRIKTFEDAKKLMHPLEYCCVAFSAEKTGQKKNSFTVTLAHCDTTKFIEPWRGNTIIEQREIVFRRKVPPQNIPRWLRSQTTPAAGPRRQITESQREPQGARQ